MLQALDQAIELLQGAPWRFYCERCVSDALRVPHIIAHDMVAALATRTDYRYALWRCDSCDRGTAAIGFVPPVQCARCTWPIADNDAFVVQHNHLFHSHCWRILESDARVADSRQLAQLSRDLIGIGVTRLMVGIVTP